MAAQIAVLDYQHYMRWFVPVLIGGAVGAGARWRCGDWPRQRWRSCCVCCWWRPPTMRRPPGLRPVEGTFPAAGPHQAAGDGGVRPERHRPAHRSQPDPLCQHARPGTRWSVLDGGRANRRADDPAGLSRRSARPATAAPTRHSTGPVWRAWLPADRRATWCSAARTPHAEATSPRRPYCTRAARCPSAPGTVPTPPLTSWCCSTAPGASVRSKLKLTLKSRRYVSSTSHARCRTKGWAPDKVLPHSAGSRTYAQVSVRVGSGGARVG